MKTWKLVFGFLLVSLLSAGVAIGTYSYLNRKNGTAFSNNSINRQGFREVGYATPAENTDFTYAAEQTVNAVVHIKSVAKLPERNRDNRDFRGNMDPFEFFFGDGNPFGQFQRQPRVGFGSGVIISNDGYIVTNNHVIDGADEIEVTTNDDQVYKAKLIGNDAATDVALLKIEGKDFHALPFGDSDALKIGEWVLAVGNPFNLTSTVTAGIISAKGRSDFSYGYGPEGGSPQDKIQSYIQTDAAVNPGNSGGALVNTKGELIGITSMIYSETGNYVGYSFAIPINMVQKIVSDIKQYGIVQRAKLGILYNELAVLKEKEPDKFNKLKVNDGVYVADFPFNSSSQKAGIQVGDVITAINDVKVKNGQDLRAQLSRYSPGDKINVQVQRGDASKTFAVELKNDQGTTDVVKQKSPKDILGATLKELPDQTKTRLGINYGIEVTDLSNGKLKSAGIRKGFIILGANDTRISSSDDLEMIVSDILKKDPDDRGLYIKGFYPDTRRMEYVAIDLNN
jgi:Do/DeqQ family serine protease